MAHSYAAEYPPGIAVSPDIEEFFSNFYRVSDTPGAHDEYVDLFAEDATFILASKQSVGHTEITTTRHGMWAAVESRKHTIFKIFPFGADSTEFMLYGAVKFRLKTGSEADVPWAARACIVQSQQDSRWRMKFYQVYLDSAATSAYKK